MSRFHLTIYLVLFTSDHSHSPFDDILVRAHWIKISYTFNLYALDTNKQPVLTSGFVQITGDGAFQELDWWYLETQMKMWISGPNFSEFINLGRSWFWFNPFYSGPPFDPVILKVKRTKKKKKTERGSDGPCHMSRVKFSDSRTI